jgi:hypothetical protein
MESDMKNWNPQLSGGSFQTKNIHGTPLVNEQVYFIPDTNIKCNPPYVKGKEDTCWVKYRKGTRPTTKEGWEFILGMSLQSMV